VVAADPTSAQARLTAYVSLLFSSLSAAIAFLFPGSGAEGSFAAIVCAILAMITAIVSVVVRAKCAAPRPIAPVVALVFILLLLASYAAFLHVASQLTNFGDQ
jgi:hypothetical protein